MIPSSNLLKRTARSVLKALSAEGLVADRGPSRVLRFWKTHQASTNPCTRSGDAFSTTAFLFPADPRTLDGSIGDQAMLHVALMKLKEAGATSVDIMVDGDAGERRALELGLNPIRMPHLFEYPAFVSELYGVKRYRQAVFMGADVLDGKYGLGTPVRLLIACDLMFRRGADAIFLGFSFNSKPDPRLARFFDALHPGIVLNARDASSLERLRKFTKHTNMRLVADSAFLLQPGSPDALPPDLLSWLSTTRSAGHTIVGVNFHPMLFKDGEKDQLASAARNLARVLASVGPKQNVHWLLLPHDTRPNDGDHSTLAQVACELNSLGAPFFFQESTLSAELYKALAMMTDAIITGRMHLSIASLGSTTPVFCFTYQDKFEGLLKHFGMDGDLLSDPKALLYDVGNLGPKLDAFIANRESLRAQIRTRLPDVKALAQQVFSEPSSR